MTTSIDKKHSYKKAQLISIFSSSLAKEHPVDWPYAEFLAEKSGSGQPIKAREPQQYQQPTHQQQVKYPVAGNTPGSTQKSGTSNDWRQSTNTSHHNQGTNVNVNSGMNRNSHTNNANANGGGGNMMGGGHMTAEQQRKMFENERRQIEQERENKSKGGDSSSANLLSPDKPSTSLFHDETDNLMKELAVNNNKPLSPAGTKKISVNSLFGSPSAMKVQTNVSVTTAATVADDGSGIMGGLGSLPALPGIWSQSSGLSNSMPTVGSPSSKRSHNKFNALSNDDNDFDDVDFSGLIEKMIFDEDLDGGGGGEHGNNLGLGSSRFGGLGFNVKDVVDPLPINASSDLSPSTSSKHVAGLLSVTSTPSGIEELSGMQSSAVDSGGKNSSSFDVLSKLGFQSPTSPPPPSNPQQQQHQHPQHNQQQHPQHPHQPPMYNNMPPNFPHSPMMMDPRLMPPYGGGSPPPHMGGHIPMQQQQQHFPGQSPGGPPSYGGMPHHPPPWMGMRPPVVPHHPHSPQAFAHHPRGMSPPYHPSHYPPRPLHPGQHPQPFAPPGGMMMSSPLPEGMPPPQPQHHYQQQSSPRPLPPPPAPSNQFTFHIHNASGRGISKGGGHSTGQPPSSDALVTPNGGGTPSQSTISSSGSKVTQSSPIMSASARQLMKMLKVPVATKTTSREVVASPASATVNSIAQTNEVISNDIPKVKPEAVVSVIPAMPLETPQALQRINVNDLFKKKSTTDIAVDK